MYHPKYSELAKAAARVDPDITLAELPQKNDIDTTRPELPLTVQDDRRTSHIFHTSGTSGTPKPIPQNHLGSTKVLPRRALPSYLRKDAPIPSTLPPAESAAFTTTPLFHGGISDLLRAWMARSMIYFYPTSDVPITTSYLCKAVEACNQYPGDFKGMELSTEQEGERKEWFRTTAFLSVPYILNVLVEDQDGEGVSMLKGMRLVSTGGAPLDRDIGNRMVAKGIKLVSRLGSSECGCKQTELVSFRT